VEKITGSNKELTSSSMLIFITTCRSLCIHPTVETVLEGNSDDGDRWPEREGLAGDLANDAQVNLNPRPSGASGETGTTYDSGLQTLAIDTSKKRIKGTLHLVGGRALGTLCWIPKIYSSGQKHKSMHHCPKMGANNVPNY